MDLRCAIRVKPRRNRWRCAVEVVRLARQEGRRAQITISTAFGCPFDGEVDPQRVIDMAKVAAAAGPVEVAIADTIGVASPRDVAESGDAR